MWRFCVNYRALNVVTQTFAFPILRCSEIVEDFRNSNGRCYTSNWITVRVIIKSKWERWTKRNWYFLPPKRKGNICCDTVWIKECTNLLYYYDEGSRNWMEYMLWSRQNCRPTQSAWVSLSHKSQKITPREVHTRQ